MTNPTADAAAIDGRLHNSPANTDDDESLDWWPPRLELEQVDVQAGREQGDSPPPRAEMPARPESDELLPAPTPPPIVQSVVGPPPPSRQARSWILPAVVAALALIAAIEGAVLWQQRTRPSTGSVEGPLVRPQPAGVPAALGTAGGTAGSTLTEAARSERAAGAAKPAAGRLIIRSEPAGARISIDGRVYGLTPATIDGIAAGDHQVELKLNDAQVRQAVKVEPGATLSIVAPLQPAAPATGWVTIASSAELDVLEDGQLVGSSRTPRLMVFEGQRTLDLVNDAIGFRERRRVRVEKGKTVAIAVTLPNNNININAVPWADVWLDGKHLGETPLGSLVVPIGPHDLVFRHPELGEKKVATLVKQGAPVRVTADMRSK